MGLISKLLGSPCFNAKPIRTIWSDEKASIFLSRSAAMPSSADLNKTIFESTDVSLISFFNAALVLRTPHIDVPKFYFYELWGMKFNKGQRTLVHNHMGANWSGVFCIDTDKNAAQINFPEMDHAENMIPISLYLFPGMMLHSTNPSLGKYPRVAVSFNLMTSHTKVV